MCRALECRSLICELLEDQGGDMKDVRAMIKVRIDPLRQTFSQSLSASHYISYFPNVLGMVCIGMAKNTGPKVALFLLVGMGWLPKRKRARHLQQAERAALLRRAGKKSCSVSAGLAAAVA